MARIERIPPDASPSTEAIDVPVASVNPPPPAAEISFELSKGRGTAFFRTPITADLRTAEQQGVNLANSQDLPNLARVLAKITCLRWGEASEMPPPEKIRRQDSDQKALVFMGVLSGMFQNTADGTICRSLPGQSSRHDGFDAYEVTLTDSTVLVFDEPTERDVQQREKSPTHTDGMIRLASALCTSWDGQPIKWSESLARFESLTLEDMFRVSTTLNTFSG